MKKRQMPRKGFIWLTFLTLTFSGCQKEEDVQLEEREWHKFIGTYNVTKLENNETYQMTITHLGTDTLENKAIRDSLMVSNYADLFDFVVYYATNVIHSPYGSFRPIGGNPMVDKFGERWAFSVSAQDTTTEELENILSNDSLLLYFKLNNVAYYHYDNVPFYECRCKHLAIKQ